MVAGRLARLPRRAWSLTVADGRSRDLIIRSRLLPGRTEFAVFEAGSEEPVGGPYGSLTEAVECVLAQGHPTSGVFYQALDDKGRAIGAPMRLRFERQ